eukprot:567182-Amphidinium_carterae.3
MQHQGAKAKPPTSASAIAKQAQYENQKDHATATRESASMERKSRKGQAKRASMPCFEAIAGIWFWNLVLRCQCREL